MTKKLNVVVNPEHREVTEFRKFDKHCNHCGNKGIWLSQGGKEGVVCTNCETITPTAGFSFEGFLF